MTPAPTGGLDPGSARPGRENGAPGPAARGSRASALTPGSCHRGSPAVRTPDGPTPAGVPCIPAAQAQLVGGCPPSRSVPEPLPTGERARPPGPPFNPALLPPLAPGWPPPPSARPLPTPGRTPARQRHPAASRNLTPSFASCAPPRPAANFLRPTSERAGRPDGPAEREGSPRRAAGPPGRYLPNSERRGGHIAGLARPTPLHRVRLGTRPPGPYATRGSAAASTAGSARRRRGRGCQGDVSLAARPAPAPQRPARKPPPRPLQGPAKFLTCSRRRVRESERAGAAAAAANRKRAAGRASAEKPPPSSCKHRDPDAVRPVRRPLRPLAGCVRACGVVALSASELANGPLRRDHRLLPSQPGPAIHRVASPYWSAPRHSASH